MLVVLLVRGVSLEGKKDDVVVGGVSGGKGIVREKERLEQCWWCYWLEAYR